MATFLASFFFNRLKDLGFLIWKEKSSA